MVLRQKRVKSKRVKSKRVKSKRKSKRIKTRQSRKNTRNRKKRRTKRTKNRKRKSRKNQKGGAGTTTLCDICSRNYWVPEMFGTTGWYNEYANDWFSSGGDYSGNPINRGCRGVQAQDGKTYNAGDRVPNVITCCPDCEREKKKIHCKVCAGNYFLRSLGFGGRGVGPQAGTGWYDEKAKDFFPCDGDYSGNPINWDCKDGKEVQTLDKKKQDPGTLVPNMITICPGCEEKALTGGGIQGPDGTRMTMFEFPYTGQFEVEDKSG